MNKKKIIILATEGLTTNLLYNELVKHFNVQAVVIEKKISKKIILKNRIKRLGIFKVVGQVLFMVTVVPVLTKLSKKRQAEIIKQYNKDKTSIPTDIIQKVESINNSKVLEIIHKNSPELIFVNGTRIISKKIIEESHVKLINIHVGITPKYRGVHGGYWALFNNDVENFGTTIHFIDSGVDTGDVIEQSVIRVTPIDNYVTYPVLQFCEGIELIKKNRMTITQGVIKTKSPIVSESRLHYQPTLLQYLNGRLFSRVK